MRWTWPSWLAIVLGVLVAVLGFVWHDSAEFMGIAPAFLVAGALLVAAGLHALQGAWTACCDYGGCDCDHCGSCSSGDCCGKCDCYGGGHEHGNGEKGHSH